MSKNPALISARSSRIQTVLSFAVATAVFWIATLAWAPRHGGANEPEPLLCQLSYPSCNGWCIPPLVCMYYPIGPFACNCGIPIGPPIDP